MNEKEIKAYYQGLIDGIEMFAHWNDGEQYVGTCGMTLKEAYARMQVAQAAALQQLEDRRNIQSELGYSRIGLNNV